MIGGGNIPKLILSYKNCAYSTPYELNPKKRICSHPKGSPWCEIHPHDMIDGFPWNCPLEDAK